MRPAIHTKIGQTNLNHFAILVRTGMLRGAVSFFVDQLGWREDKEGRVSGDWGEARFVMTSTTSAVRVQLTELKDGVPEGMLPGVHLAISVLHPKEAAEEIMAWAEYASIDVSVEEVPGGKFFVSLPNILATDIELVPSIVWAD